VEEISLHVQNFLFALKENAIHRCSKPENPSNWLHDLVEVQNEPSIIANQPKEWYFLDPWLLIHDFFHILGSTVIPSGETT
jgi:hypothetical protein